MDNKKLDGNSRPLKTGDGVPAQIGSGMNFPLVKLVQILPPDDWEGFTEEWAHSLEPGYNKVVRFTGAGDMGRDVVGFSSEEYFNGPWDNYQCKRYGVQLQPAHIWVELGKIIYYSHIGEFKPPQNYYFAASMDIGLKLKKLLTKPAELKKLLTDNWEGYCRDGITETASIPLEGDLNAYLDAFDFKIFKALSLVEMLKGHSKTIFHARRFGVANIPPRPKVDLPPVDLQPNESRYVKQLLQAYSEYLSVTVTDIAQLSKWPEIERHFNRSRELFYHAESLRSFARDSVDPGTFDAVTDEIYHGVVDKCDLDYPNGLVRVRSTVSHAGTLTPSCNALCVRVQTQDKHGICHHLANENRLKWVKNNA